MKGPSNRVAIVALVIVGLVSASLAAKKQGDQGEYEHEPGHGEHGEHGYGEHEGHDDYGTGKHILSKIGENSYGSGITNILTGKNKVAPQESAPRSKSEAGKEIATVVGAGPSAIAKEAVKENELAGKKDKGLFGLFSLEEWTKYLFNPFEFCKAIIEHFKLPMEKFLEILGKPLVFGIEAMLHPLVTIIKIVEKVFVPDVCRLKFLCKMGTHALLIKEHVLKFSSHFLEESLQIKALTDGIVGKDCEKLFPNCEPKLKKTFEDLKSGGGDREGGKQEVYKI